MTKRRRKAPSDTDALGYALKLCADHPRGAEGIADELGLSGGTRGVFLMMAREGSAHGAASVIDALEKARHPSKARADLTGDQRRLLDALGRELTTTGGAPDLLALAKSLGWKVGRVSRVGDELRDLGMVTLR